MGEAREVLDRATAARLGQDFDAMAACYAENAVAVTPDQGEIRGRQAVLEYLRQQTEAFPGTGYEPIQKHESDNVAIDEGYLSGTHTKPLPMPSGDAVPPTGKQIRVRACDVATVEGGVITRHHFYFDQMEVLEQLGLGQERGVPSRVEDLVGVGSIPEGVGVPGARGLESPLLTVEISPVGPGDPRRLLYQLRGNAAARRGRRPHTPASPGTCCSSSARLLVLPGRVAVGQQDTGPSLCGSSPHSYPLPVVRPAPWADG